MPKHRTKITICSPDDFAALFWRSRSLSDTILAVVLAGGSKENEAATFPRRPVYPALYILTNNNLF